MPVRFCSAVAIALLSGLAASSAAALVPRLLGYQGRLLRADGTAATGTASVTFTVFAAESGGSLLWTETQTLGLSDGYYSTFLGLVAPPSESLFDGEARWLEIRVGSETLAPRQQLGAVSYALAAGSVRGGSADVASLKVDGLLVLDSFGRLSGTARYSAGAGLVIDDSTQVISVRTCPSGQALLHDDQTWQCAPVPTVTAVKAVAPLSVTDGSTTPVISMLQATANTSGFLSSLDWSSFNARFGASTQCGGDLSGSLASPAVVRLQSRPVSGNLPTQGQVLKWTGTQWEPAEDARSVGTVTDVTAVAPLSIWNGTSTPQISLGAASGTADGYLSASDWQRFEAKYGSATQCGGDLEGALISPVVAGIRGVSVDTTVPATSQVLRFDGSRWAPASLSVGDVGGLSSGYLDLSGSQTIGGAKAFTAAPVFGTPLAVSSGGIGTTTADANSFFAGPSGAPGVPSFRALADDDIPPLDASKMTTGTLGVSRGGTGTSAQFGAGSVLFAGNGGAYAQNHAGFYWDDANGRLGIGTSSPAYRLDVQGGDIHAGGSIRADGSILGNLTGNVTGNVSGNVTGSLTGGVTGNVNGNLAGNVTGDVAGNLTGNVNGNVTGNLTGNVNGNVAGNLTGNVTGNLTGTVILGNTVGCATGAIRFDGTHFQGCDGTRWLNLDNVPPPSVQSITPNWGSIAAGTPITVTGSNFQALATVMLGGAACTGVNIASTTTITATAPAGTAGVVDVKVQNPDFQAGTLVSGFTYVRPPAVTAFNPSDGSLLGGGSVTITGTDFTGTPTVTFGATGATVTSASSGTLVVTLPAGSAGTATVTVRNPAPYALAGTGTFTYRVPGATQTVPATNCNSIKTLVATDSIQWIDPDGAGATYSAFQTLCDMTTDGGGWTLVAYAGDRSGGFPRMDTDVGSFNASSRSGKASKYAVALTRASTSMALAYHSTTNWSGYLSSTTDAVSFGIPDPSVVDLATSGNNGTCTAVTTKRLKPNGSTKIIVGSWGTQAAVEAGVWSKSLGGTYGGNFAYGLYATMYSCNSWPDVSHHWWVDTQYYNWEPSATQPWAGTVEGSTTIWVR